MSGSSICRFQSSSHEGWQALGKEKERMGAECIQIQSWSQRWRCYLGWKRTKTWSLEWDFAEIGKAE